MHGARRAPAPGPPRPPPGAGCGRPQEPPGVPGAGPKPPTRCFPVGCGALCVCVCTSLHIAVARLLLPRAQGHVRVRCPVAWCSPRGRARCPAAAQHFPCSGDPCPAGTAAQRAVAGRGQRVSAAQEAGVSGRGAGREPTHVQHLACVWPGHGSVARGWAVASHRLVGPPLTWAQCWHPLGEVAWVPPPR